MLPNSEEEGNIYLLFRKKYLCEGKMDYVEVEEFFEGDYEISVFEPEEENEEELTESLEILSELSKEIESF